MTDKLFFLFSKKEKRKMIGLFILMLFAALFEVFSIGIIVPFVGVITQPSFIYEQPILFFLYKFFKIRSTESFVLLAVVILMLVFVIKNIYLLFYQYLQNKVLLNQQVKLANVLFGEYLTKPYSFHLNRNTAELLRNVNNEVNRVIQGIILSFFQLLTEILVVICILALLFINALEATLAASFLLGSTVFIFSKIFKRKTISLGQEQQFVTGQMIKWVNQGLGASKEVKVSGKEGFFIKSYSKQCQLNANNTIKMKMLEVIPRYFIETLLVGTVLLTMIIVTSQGNDTNKIISTMTLFAMSAFRLMPSISRIVGLINTIRFSQPALLTVYGDLSSKSEIDQKLITQKKAIYPNKLNSTESREYRESIKLVDVSFRYPNQETYSIKDVSLTIPIGKAVAFIGESGAGKTTIIDIILGLYPPEKGKVLVDNIKLEDQIETWRDRIGYIPQSIYLSDDSIRGNVAFGIDPALIDDEKVWQALDQAQLKEFVEDLPEKLNTSVGERGVRLSGGQRQRIGIARALYHNPEILVMDEATSALDNETEKGIMKAIESLKGEKTLIIIAHRLSTIENCDIVYKMSKGRLMTVNNMAIQTS